jgi:steroid delta-isomerase-like uncharacterized protein
MSVEQTKAIGTKFFQEQDRLRGGPSRDLCAPGYVARIAGFPALDIAGHEHFSKAFYEGFPDLQHAVEEAVAEGDRVVVRFTLRGTHKGSFMGVPATGKPISVSAVAILKVAGGKVSQLEGVFDQAGLMRQLGLLPEPSAAKGA